MRKRTQVFFFDASIIGGLSHRRRSTYLLATSLESVMRIYMKNNEIV